MSACCSAFESAADQQFNEKKAMRELKRYRSKGPGPTTRHLQASLADGGALSGTLLDIGSGIGSLTLGLLERGVARAIAVDASSAYIAVARQEAERVDRAAAVEFVHADFVSVASKLPAATLVTLDRVVCCYFSYEALLNAALRHAEVCIALSYPRDVWYVRLGVMLENAQRRLTKNSFRTFVHSASVGRLRAVHSTEDVDVVRRYLFTPTASAVWLAIVRFRRPPANNHGEARGNECASHMFGNGYDRARTYRLYERP